MREISGNGVNICISMDADRHNAGEDAQNPDVSGANWAFASVPASTFREELFPWSDQISKLKSAWIQCIQWLTDTVASCKESLRGDDNGE